MSAPKDEATPDRTPAMAPASEPSSRPRVKLLGALPASGAYEALYRTVAAIASIGAREAPRLTRRLS